MSVLVSGAPAGLSGSAGPASVSVALPSRAGGGHSSSSGRSSSSRSSSSRSSSSRSSSSRSSSGAGSSFAGGVAGGAVGSSIGRRNNTSSRSEGGSVFGAICCILIVVLIVIALVIVIKKKGKGAGEGKSLVGKPFTGPPPQNSPPPPPADLPVPESARAALAAIKERDPGFDEAEFLDGVGTSFMLVQKAWCDQAPAESRKVMADALWVDHKGKIDTMAAQGYRNVLENLHIGRAQIVDAVTDADSESLKVRIHAYSTDIDIDPRTTPPTIVRGDRLTRLWTEDWIFTRSSSATTKAGGGNREHCPNCGAPLNLDASGTCGYCREMVMAGKYDWVLSRIEQVYDAELT